MPGSTTRSDPRLDFELEVQAPAKAAATAVGPASDLARMQRRSAEARRVLEQSGRYQRRIDIQVRDTGQERSLRSTAGVEAALALTLGAQQSLIGVVTRGQD
jgi:hypothetical protein